jgi:Na+-driven multidrug efflux pump
MMKLVRLSSTGTFQVLVSTASWIGLVRILATFGSQALAGYTIAIRIVLFALLPSWGMSNAAATMVGQALGARKPERAEKAVWIAGFYNLCFLGAVSLVFFFAARPIVALFTQEPAVAEFARDALRVIALGFMLYAYGMVVSQAFNGAGDTWTPTLLNMFAFWLVEIPLAYALAVVFGFGPHGVFIAITGAFSLFALLAIALFRRGTWKAKMV